MTRPAPATVLVYVLAASSFRWLVSDLFRPEHQFFYNKREFKAERDGILEVLNKRPGKQLVLVRYGPKHEVNLEWVYNRADIDGSSIAWAHSMGPARDASLVAYFRDRQAWYLDENGTAVLTPYAGQQ